MVEGRFLAAWLRKLLLARSYWITSPASSISEFLFLVGGLPGREEIGRRELHLVADHDRLRARKTEGTASSSVIWLASSKMTTSK